MDGSPLPKADLTARIVLPEGASGKAFWSTVTLIYFVESFQLLRFSNWTPVRPIAVTEYWDSIE